MDYTTLFDAVMENLGDSFQADEKDIKVT